MKTLNTFIQNIQNNYKNDMKLIDIKYIINDYNGTDWKKYVKINDIKYNRNSIFKNNVFEVVIITWKKEQNVGIHRHPSRGCLFKILQGEMSEKVYNKSNDTYILKEENFYKKNQVSYIEDSIGYHSVENVNNDTTVSLHIYSPPFDSKCFN